MSAFRSILGKVNTCIEYILVVLSLLMVAIVFLQVVARYGFAAGVGWSEELVRYIFIWMVFLGGSVAIHHKANLYIESFVNMMPPAYRRTCHIISILLSMLLFFFMVYYGLSIMPIVSFQTSPGLEVSMIIPYACIPLGGALMLIYAFANLLELLRGGKGGTA